MYLTYYYPSDECYCCPRLFETVRFPMRDKSETLSSMFATLCDFTNIAKITQNNIPVKEYRLLCSGLLYNTKMKMKNEQA